MAFDERLADRMRSALGRRRGLTEKKMFGGIGFLLNGNMCCGIHKSAMIVRIAPEGFSEVCLDSSSEVMRLGSGRNDNARS